MKIAIGADHAGYEAKEYLRGWLAEHGRHVVRVETMTSLDRSTS